MTRDDRLYRAEAALLVAEELAAQMKRASGRERQEYAALSGAYIDLGNAWVRLGQATAG